MGVVKLCTYIALSFLLFQCQSSDQNFIFAKEDYKDPIPLPQSYKNTEGKYFSFSSRTSFEYHKSLLNEGNYLESLINTQLEPDNHGIQNTVKLTVSPSKILDSLNNDEAYEIHSNAELLEINASTKQGLMRGIQTIRQLLPDAFYEGESRKSWGIPLVDIVDYPKFQHRGMLLDVCRHFFDKDVVLKYIDALALYKMNVLHFHLTEDQGWRIPIEKYPLLTEVGAWRKDTSGNLYGGFYTKEELQEIVDYAAVRHITVIPEIELPGHAQAALAAYPQFSCTGGPIEVANDWGVFKEIYCAGNDSTFAFIEDILTEVMEIFPSKYIHIGGDEAPKFRWEHCAKCQKRMKDEGLADEHELQSYFITRIEMFLNDNGRELIGWDEILEGGLSPNATVQSWRGFEGGIQAAETQHKVIMSPTSHCYLDYDLSSIDLKKIYSFDPIPKELDSKYHSYIIGGEGNMWTEHVPDEDNLDSKVFPRIIGLADVLWSYNPDRDFEAFYDHLQSHYKMLKALGINFGMETIGASISVDSGKIILNKNLKDLELKYKWDDEAEVEYKEPIELNKSGTLSAQAYKKSEKYGNPVTQVFEIHKGLGATAQYTNAWNQWYTAGGENGLVDGKIGSIDFRDGNWQGFWGEDVVVVVDLGEGKHFIDVILHFYQYANSWIFSPKEVALQTSIDGENWNTERHFKYKNIDMSNEKRIEEIRLTSDKKLGFYGRYVKITAKNIGKVPDGHEAAGSDAWVFMDEIIIK